jgi:hypothetical protein
MTTTYSIEGHVIGGMWWPIGEPATKPVSFTFERGDMPRRPFTEQVETLLEAVEALTTREGGDFSTAARLTADSVLVVTHRTARREVRRWFPLSLFASLTDYLSDEYPFEDE